MEHLTTRIWAAALSLLLSFVPAGAWALGLGNIEVSSTLNEPLQARIDLSALQSGDLDSMQVQLASAEQFRRAGIDRPFELSKLQFTTLADGADSGHIAITTRDPVVEPFLNFLVEVTWPRGRIVREYTLLLDPPVYGAAISTQARQELAEIQARALQQPSAPEPAAAPIGLWARFSQQAHRTPDRVALHCKGERLSYRELEHRSLAIAAAAKSLGADLETVVGLMLHRSPDLLAALLGAACAGAAYLPLDPSHPQPRLQAMLSDCRAGLIVTESGLLDQLPQTTTARPLLLEEGCLGRKNDFFEAQPGRTSKKSFFLPRHPERHRGFPEVDAENLAYVLFTSGSTGRPKGVEVTQGGLTRYLQWCAENYFRFPGRGD